MSIASELDKANSNYKPNLDSIYESAMVTYAQANEFFRKEMLFIKDIYYRLNNNELINGVDIYAACNASASGLAECCEMYLKAIYIYEHNIPNEQLESIWNTLMAQSKNDSFRRDAHGNKVYYKENIDGTIEYVYAKLDETGNAIKDSNNPSILIYIDQNGNEYRSDEVGRIKPVKENGHQLDRLIRLLAPDTRLLLETIMLTTSMEETQKHENVSIIDILKSKGFIVANYQATHEELYSWIDQHKKTFEETRYAGQKTYDIKIEFLLHLATQLKAVCQYKLKPVNEQALTLSDDELKNMPVEVQELANINENLLSKGTIELIIENESFRTKISNLISLKCLSHFNGLQINTFTNMLQKLELSEIQFLSYLSDLLTNYNKSQKESLNSDVENLTTAKKAITIIGLLNKGKTNVNDLVLFCLELKRIFHTQLNNQFFNDLYDLLKIDKLYRLDEVMYSNNYNQYNNYKDLINNKNINYKY